MAQHLHSFVIASFFLALSFIVAFTSEHDYPGLKSLHFTVYQQGTLNKTSYLILNGVDTGEAMSPYAAPFGTLQVYYDPLTIGPSRSSKVVGTIEGISVASSLDGLQTVSLTKMSLSLMNHTGSISVVGGAANLTPDDLTIVGGTGDFMFAQGYLRSSPFELNGTTTYVYKNEFHLYWPIYATRPPYATY